MTEFFSLFSKNVRSVLAVMVVFFSFVFLFILCFHSIPKENETVINVASGLILAALGAVVAYYFGASKDASDKNKAEIAQTSASDVRTTITKQEGEPDPKEPQG